MRRAGTLETRRQTALDWAANWHADHDDVIRKLEKAIGGRDIATAGQFCGQLKALHEKALGALPRVIEALSDEDIV